MRTKSAQVSGILASPIHTARVEVDVRNAGDSAEWSLHSLSGITPSMIESVEITESVDAHATATVMVRRQLGRRSLAPLTAGGNNPLATSSSDPVLEVGRRIIIRAGVQPGDGDVSLVTPMEVFRGYIDEIDWSEDPVRVSCSDATAKLRDTFIEWERVYGLCTGVYATKGAYIWRSQGDAKVLAVGDLVVPSKLNANGHFYRVTAAASAQATVEPTWPTGGGSTVVSGGVTLTESGSTSNTGLAVESIMQQIIDDNGLSSLFTLYTPTSPSWVVRPFIQSRESVLDALETLSQQLGWLLKYKWDNGTSAFRLTLYAPDRAAIASSKTISLLEEEDFTATKAVAEVRNAIRVVYGDRSSRDAEGLKTRIVVEVTDATSITKYGRRFMEIGEAEASNIDTITEATQLANAVLSDLKDPVLPMEIGCAVDPYMELGDLVTVQADGLRLGSDQTLAIAARTDTYEATASRSKFSLRGKPSAGVLNWLMKDTRIAEPVHLLTPGGQTSITKTITSIIGGARMEIVSEAEGSAKLAEQFEFHVSPTAAFTPGPTTLKGAGQINVVEVVNLVPGKTYYGKWVPFGYNAAQKVLGAPSVEQSFVAGRAKTGHYDSGSTQSHLPLNGNFEHASDDLASAPPDHWQVVTRPTESTEEWGSAGSVYYGEDFTTKGRYLELRAHASKRGNIMSSPFEVRRGSRAVNLYLSIMRTGASAASGKDLIIDIEGYSDAAMANLKINYSITLSGDGGGPYPSLSTWYDVAIDVTGTTGAFTSSVNFLRIGLRRGTTGDNSFAWRVGDVYFQESDFKNIKADAGNITALTASSIAIDAWTAPTFGTNWANYGGGTNNLNAGYYIDPMGRIHLRGLITRSSGGAAAFTLPSGYRPSKTAWFNQPNSVGTDKWVAVNSNGDVHIATFGGNYSGFVDILSLDGIYFDTR